MSLNSDYNFHNFSFKLFFYSPRSQHKIQTEAVTISNSRCLCLFQSIFWIETQTEITTFTSFLLPRAVLSKPCCNLDPKQKGILLCSAYPGGCRAVRATQKKQEVKERVFYIYNCINSNALPTSNNCPFFFVKVLQYTFFCVGIPASALIITIFFSPRRLVWGTADLFFFGKCIAKYVFVSQMT